MLWILCLTHKSLDVSHVESFSNCNGNDTAFLVGCLMDRQEWTGPYNKVKISHVSTPHCTLLLFPLSYSDRAAVKQQFKWFHDTGSWIKIEVQWSRIQISYQANRNSNLWWNSYACSLFPWYLTKKLNNKKHGNRVKSEFTSGEHPPTQSPLSPRKNKKRLTHRWTIATQW